MSAAEQFRVWLADNMPTASTDRIQFINDIRRAIHDVSPFRDEPVDFVEWVPFTAVTANDYNPNSVAPPEMELLRLSIAADGYTQPVVTNQEDDTRIVVDGFHRNRVGREYDDVRERLHGHLPVVQIRGSRVDRSDRIASTIRHNRARGKHSVSAMSDIVVELKRRNWTNDKIGRELGMDPDEVLRLCQMTGLTELFANEGFSASWDVDSVPGDDPDALADLIGSDGTSTEPASGRIFHTWDEWECYPAGMYETKPPHEGMTADECREAYADFFRDLDRFRTGLEGVLTDWPHSTEHYLTNERMNRIAWLGQAAVCHQTRIPRAFRSGFMLLTEPEQDAANQLALEYLNKFRVNRGEPALTMEEAQSKTEADLY